MSGAAAAPWPAPVATGAGAPGAAGFVAGAGGGFACQAVADGASAGRTLVAVDSVGAGVGETVFFVRGKEASFPFYPTEVPTDAGIVGIVDHWDLG